MKHYPCIMLKSLDLDFVVVDGPKSVEILARAKTYDEAREKAILLKLEMPRITRERYLGTEEELKPQNW